MSLSKSGIKAEVASRTARSVSEISDYLIREILVDLTLELEGYAIYATASTIAGQANYTLKAFPEEFKDADVVKISDKPPLKRIPSWAHYQTLIAEQSSVDYEEPTHFIVYDDILYLFPTPDAVYPLNLWGTKVEFDDDDMDLPSYFEPAIIEGLCNLLYSAKGLGYLPKAQDHLQKYLNFKNKLLALEQKKASTGMAQPDVI